MEKDRIDAAMEAAIAFINAVSDMHKEEEGRGSVYDGIHYQYTSPKHRGAVRRKSMDLTRALAEMRKP